MKSPFTGGEVRMIEEPHTTKFRGREYTFLYQSYLCVDTGETFTTTELDERNMARLYDKYREENGIPSVSEIVKIRHRYGVSAKTMSYILGFGENQYRLYEKGELPSVSNGRLLQSIIRSSKNFIDYTKDSRKIINSKTYKKIMGNFVSSYEDVYMCYDSNMLSRGFLKGRGDASEKRDVFCVIESVIVNNNKWNNDKERGVA